MIRPISHASETAELLGTYQNRCVISKLRYTDIKPCSDSIAYVRGIGEIVSGVAAAVPQGMLVFFASYAQMNKFMNAWKVRHSLLMHIG